MRAAGFEPEDYEGDVIEVWPENLPALQMFQRIGTRWVVAGMGGVTGLRWEAIYPLMDRLNLTPDAWDALLSDLEVMERAALEVLNRKDDK
jgi:hypothetical protein